MKNTDLIRIDLAVPDDLTAVLDLLDACGLPRDGLSDHFDTALVLRQGDKLVGSAALELYNGNALIRSLAVAPNARGKRLGKLLTHATLNLARQYKVHDVYLLTESATDFFSNWGFQTIERSDVAPEVQQSVEFANGYGARSQVMRLELS